MADRSVGFVLGGGGQLGAHEVGMLRALVERGIVPDVVVGTSVGAINGAAVATDPSVEMVERLGDTWAAIERGDLFAGSLLRRLGTLARTGTHLHGNERLRALLTEALPVARIEALPVRFQCVAASIERAAEHWFVDGPLVDAVLASPAVPGILPAVAIGGEALPRRRDRQHHPGGPGRAVGCDRDLCAARRSPRGCADAAAMAVGGRARGLRDRPPPPLSRRPGVAARVDRGACDANRAARAAAHNDLSQLRYRETAAATQRIERAYDAVLAYLDGLTP